MSLLRRLVPFRPSEWARPSLRRRVAGTANSPATAGDLAVPAPLSKDERSPAHADLTRRLDGLLDEIRKLGREQFRATTLLEGQDGALQELAAAWREQLGRHERATAELHRALTTVAEQARLGLVTDLLPVADALAASVRAARELPVGPRAAPRVEGEEPGHQSWLDRLFGGARPAHEPDEPAASSDADDGAAREAWIEGVRLVERRLLALLEREGVRPIPALGEPFDPHLHLAVAVEHDGSVPEGTVIGEELRGYARGERILRHAEVVVARAGDGGIDTQPGAGCWGL